MPIAHATRASAALPNGVKSGRDQMAVVLIESLLSIEPRSEPIEPSRPTAGQSFGL